MNDFPPSQDFPAKEPMRFTEEDLLEPRYSKDLDPYEEGGKLNPIRGHTSPERRKGRGVWIAATIILFVIVLGLSGSVVFLLSRLNTALITAPVIQNTPPTSTLAPTPTPMPTAIIRTLNLQLACQHCQEPGVVASILSYSTDPSGSTSLTVTFTNHTSSAVDMKVDTIKLLDQNGMLIPIQSSDPYVGVAAGQTVPTIINFRLTPQPGTKYTFSIVMEEANVFANFYQSPAFSFA